MTTAERRMEIISILVVSGHATARELSQELDVTRRTIMHDISVLSYGYPIYTKQGACVGVFIMDGYKPFMHIFHNASYFCCFFLSGSTGLSRSELSAASSCSLELPDSFMSFAPNRFVNDGGSGFAFYISEVHFTDFMHDANNILCELCSKKAFSSMDILFNVST